MEKLHFEIVINAPVEEVWDKMLEQESYKEWTKPFNAGGSWYEGSWEKGSKIKFIGPNPETGELGGMLSEIADNQKYQFVSIKHLGIMNNGVEDYESEEVKKWTPAFENYTFEAVPEGTKLLVDVDTNQEYSVMFKDMWPKALEILKSISE
jgi:hypothetical protein